MTPPQPPHPPIMIRNSGETRSRQYNTCVQFLYRVLKKLIKIEALILSKSIMRMNSELRWFALIRNATRPLAQRKNASSLTFSLAENSRLEGALRQVGKMCWRISPLFSGQCAGSQPGRFDLLNGKSHPNLTLHFPIGLIVKIKYLSAMHLFSFGWVLNPVLKTSWLVLYFP